MPESFISRSAVADEIEDEEENSDGEEPRSEHEPEEVWLDFLLNFEEVDPYSAL